MIKNYFKTAWRTMLINRTYSFTNLIGLTIGLVVVMLVASLVWDEMSYDRQWSHGDELYRIRTIHRDKDGQFKFRSESVPSGLATVLPTLFPEVINYTHINTFRPILAIDSVSHRNIEIEVLESDTNFFNLFDTQLLEGNPKQTIAQVKNLVITESLRQQYFPGKDILGKIFYDIPDEGPPQAYVINSVIANLPQNTHLKADAILISSETQTFKPENAGSRSGQYVRIKHHTDTAQLAKKIGIWFKNQLPNKHFEGMVFEFQSIKDIHLRSVTGWDSPMRDIYMFIGIGILILILISINFVNLTFAHAVKRTQQTGIRKALGANRSHLISQMGAESSLLFGVALILATFIYILILPAFEKYLGHPLTMVFHRSWFMFLGLVFFWILLGIICSLFPAILLSKTQTAHQLKKRLSVLQLPLNTGFTRILVSLQFSIAMTVIICMLTIRSQLQYMHNKDLGYEPKNLLVLDYTAWEGKDQTFKQVLLQNPAITAVSLSMWTPFSGGVDFKEVMHPDDPDKKEMIALITGDFDFANTFGLKLQKGRQLQPDRAFDAVVYDSVTLQREIYSNVLVSRTLAGNHGLQVNIGSKPIRHTPVGIFQDFHPGSLRYPIMSTIIEARKNWEGACMTIRVAHGQEKQALAAVTATWNKFFPNRTSQINWLEDQVKAQYQKEEKQYQQLAFFSSISLLIALLGVFGIAIYTIERRIKEIGIRKVMGASVNSIVLLLSGSFAKPVFYAVFVAVPAAWWMMHKWLENFAFRIQIPWLLFVLTSVFTFSCMLAVVGFRAAHAARTNPVDSLRDE
ncbi:FtsX-like permease family protein [Sphingobacterium alkalisoli]|uniref:FtsX-like permease family protein n=1 Tax=Sphingobacterium alkalisoli TaxID=1874115 RepID=A0A4U0H9T9_9SPHI|nr:ABC transporter permease [Sphingobacterium alkalisoli]TJY68667.1 FtsX-like permease family protein [Sphingobacterium alkalisoli]GGH04951.1 ABC transporter permease [Sphingobacterium alkalisoli]